MPRFDDFWAAYPRKENKKGCKQKWDARNLDTKADEIIEHVKKRKEEDKKWLAGYVPMPMTFINQDRWEDDYEKEFKKKARGALEDKPRDPEEVTEGDLGMARFYHVDPDGLNHSEIIAVCWPLIYSHNPELSKMHVQFMPEHLHQRYVEACESLDNPVDRPRHNRGSRPVEQHGTTERDGLTRLDPARALRD